ncbi:MAG: MarR family winged helix-turn-helix transcriptional regulator [Eubacteriales bacterium]
MLTDTVWSIYTKFKLHFYMEIMRGFQDREATLTTVETYCMEIIQALGQPTVNEFAVFSNISPQNAAYKVASLIRKGYLSKTRSEADRREYHLCPTDKYLRYYNVAHSYVETVMKRVQGHFTREECEKFVEMMDVINAEMMDEVNLNTI